jgi:hypothetical protein
VVSYLSSLPAYRTGVSPLLRGVEIGLAHGFFLPGPFIKVCAHAQRRRQGRLSWAPDKHSRYVLGAGGCWGVAAQLLWGRRSCYECGAQRTVAKFWHSGLVISFQIQKAGKCRDAQCTDVASCYLSRALCLAAWHPPFPPHLSHIHVRAASHPSLPKQLPYAPQLGPLRAVEGVAEIAGSLSAAGLVGILALCLALYGGAQFQSQPPLGVKTLSGRAVQRDSLQTAEGWSGFTAGWLVGGLSGVAWAYILTQVTRVDDEKGVRGAERPCLGGVRSWRA